MPPVLLPEMIIPGYDDLSLTEKEIFEGSPSGQKLIKFKEEISQKTNRYSLLGKLKEKISFTRDDFLDELEKKINNFIDEIATTSEYQNLCISLANNLLEKEIADFNLLTKEQQFLVTQADFTQKLVATIAAIDKQICKEQQKQSEKWFWESFDETQKKQLEIERENELSIWKKRFQESPEMTPLREAIEAQKESMRKAEIMYRITQLQYHAQELSEFFPLLNYRKNATDEPIIKTIKAKYIKEDGEVVKEPEGIDRELLSDLIFHCLQQVGLKKVDFLNLESFNKEAAEDIASAILEAFKEKKALDFDTWFKKYELKLHKFFMAQLELVNGKRWLLNIATEKNQLVGSLSFLWTNPVVAKANEFINKMADAHGFIQATNFSTRSDSFFLSILDVYNYGRHKEQISETQSIIASLLSPLLPLYNEYKDIALYEKNGYWKSLRTIVPILIVVATIILIAALLSPLILPELAFAVAFVPALLVGLALSTKYVSIKNELYKSIREWYYGGPFAIPEYQVNERMINAFGSKEQAEKIRQFYIEELKKCDNLEEAYHQKHTNGILTQTDIECRKENNTKRQQLVLEWYDIQSNKDLDFRQAPLIALNRLQLEGDEEYVRFKAMLLEESESIRTSVAEITADVKSTITSQEKLPVEIRNETEAPVIKENYRYGLFTRPKSLTAKVRLEELDQFCSQISQVIPSC